VDCGAGVEGGAEESESLKVDETERS